MGQLMGQLMGINGERILFWNTKRAKCSEINETMRDSDLSRCPCVDEVMPWKTNKVSETVPILD